MKIEIDEDKCIGAGQCVLAADAVFDQREDDGVVELLDPDPPADQHAAAEQAAALCPTAAITVRRD